MNSNSLNDAQVRSKLKEVARNQQPKELSDSGHHGGGRLKLVLRPSRTEKNGIDHLDSVGE